jgi:hypothetical protein
VRIIFPLCFFSEALGNFRNPLEKSRNPLGKFPDLLGKFRNPSGKFHNPLRKIVNPLGREIFPISGIPRSEGTFGALAWEIRLDRGQHFPGSTLLTPKTN